MGIPRVGVIQNLCPHGILSWLEVVSECVCRVGVLATVKVFWRTFFVDKRSRLRCPVGIYRVSGKHHSWGRVSSSWDA